MRCVRFGPPCLPRFFYEDGELDVGIVWQSREPKFLQSAAKADLRAFRRLQYAIYYSIGSVHISCMHDGVLELGTTRTWKKPPIFAPHDIDSVRRVSERTSADPHAHLPEFEPTRERLRTICVIEH
jgi:hypothetical protein